MSQVLKYQLCLNPLKYKYRLGILNVGVQPGNDLIGSSKIEGEIICVPSTSLVLLKDQLARKESCLALCFQATAKFDHMVASRLNGFKIQHTGDVL